MRLCARHRFNTRSLGTTFLPRKKNCLKSFFGTAVGYVLNGFCEGARRPLARQKNAMYKQNRVSERKTFFRGQVRGQNAIPRRIWRATLCETSFSRIFTRNFVSPSEKKRLTNPISEIIAKILVYGRVSGFLGGEGLGRQPEQGYG